MSVVVLTDVNFEEEILKSTGIVLVDFWAEWCGPCQMMIPILDQLATEMWKNAKVSKLNVDDNPWVAGAFKIKSIPTMIIFKDGKPVEQLVWVQQVPELKAILEKHM